MKIAINTESALTLFKNLESQQKMEQYTTFTVSKDFSQRLKEAGIYMERESIERMKKLKLLLLNFISFYVINLGNKAGGSLHIVLSDGNLEDDNIWFCQKFAKEHGDTFGFFLATLMRHFTKEELTLFYSKGWKLSDSKKTMKVFKPFLPDFIDYYRDDLGNSAGGHLHIVLEDGNIHKGHIRGCEHDAKTNGDTFGVFIAHLMQNFRENELETFYDNDWKHTQP